MSKNAVFEAFSESPKKGQKPGARFFHVLSILNILGQFFQNGSKSPPFSGNYWGEGGFGEAGTKCSRFMIATISEVAVAAPNHTILSARPPN